MNFKNLRHTAFFVFASGHPLRNLRLLPGIKAAHSREDVIELMVADGIAHDADGLSEWWWRAQATEAYDEAVRRWRAR